MPSIPGIPFIPSIDAGVAVGFGDEVAFGFAVALGVGLGAAFMPGMPSIPGIPSIPRMPSCCIAGVAEAEGVAFDGEPMPGIPSMPVGAGTAPVAPLAESVVERAVESGEIGASSARGSDAPPASGIGMRAGAHAINNNGSATAIAARRTEFGTGVSSSKKENRQALRPCGGF